MTERRSRGDGALHGDEQRQRWIAAGDGRVHPGRQTHRQEGPLAVIGARTEELRALLWSHVVAYDEDHARRSRTSPIDLRQGSLAPANGT
jgi:hypothetical protein